MLRKLLLLFITFSTVMSISAQGIESSNLVEPSGAEVLKKCTFSLGPKVGINYSFPSTAGKDINTSGNIGYSGGVAANLRFGRPAGKPFGTERFGFQLEALYALRSIKIENENLNMNTIEVPILFQWYFIPSFALEVGPTITGVFSASPETIKIGNSTYHFNNLNSGVMVTAGLNCKLKKGFTASLRYNYGTNDIAGNFNTKVSTISFGIGWLFTVIK